MSPAILPPKPPEGRTLPEQSSHSQTPSASPLTPPSSSAAPRSKIRSTALSGEASELIIPENEGVNWLPLTLEKIATVMAGASTTGSSRDSWILDRPDNSYQVLENHFDFCHVDEAKQHPYIDHYFQRGLTKLVDLLEKYPKGVYDLDVEDGPYEGKMGLSGTEINATRTQLLTNENQIAMALGDGRMETQQLSSRVAATGKLIDPEPLQLQSPLIFATALANH
jgi:hypothetical protein